jgi:hypothetical protein
MNTHAAAMSAFHPASALPGLDFELRFESLFDAGRALVFPCDAAGQVPLQQLSARARDNYFYARKVVGREYATPRVQCADARH